MNWYVVVATIKGEDKAERELHAAGFRSYAPRQRFEKYNKRKRKFAVIERRIAGRYLFVECERTADAWQAILGCKGVDHIIPYGRTPVALNRAETKALDGIMLAEADFAFDETREGKLHRREIGKTKRETTKMRFPVGSRIRVNDGPFASFGGEVVNVNGRGHIKALVSIFGRLTEIELETRQVDIAA
jgi:transcription antitermination factor NusG